MLHSFLHFLLRERHWFDASPLHQSPRAFIETRAFNDHWPAEHSHASHPIRHPGLERHDAIFSACSSPHPKMLQQGLFQEAHAGWPDGDTSRGRELQPSAAHHTILETDSEKTLGHLPDHASTEAHPAESEVKKSGKVASY